jgi:hypothetical protein
MNTQRVAKVRRRSRRQTLSMNTPLGVFMVGVQCRPRLLTLMLRSAAPHAARRQAKLSRARRVSNHEANGRASPFETRAKWRAPQGEEQQLGVFMGPCAAPASELEPHGEERSADQLAVAQATSPRRVSNHEAQLGPRPSRRSPSASSSECENLFPFPTSFAQPAGEASEKLSREGMTGQFTSLNSSYLAVRCGEMPARRFRHGFYRLCRGSFGAQRQEPHHVVSDRKPQQLRPGLDPATK